MLDEQKALFCQQGQAQDLLLPLEDPPALLVWAGIAFSLLFEQELQTPNQSFTCACLFIPCCSVGPSVPLPGCDPAVTQELFWGSPGCLSNTLQSCRKGKSGLLCSCCCFNARQGLTQHQLLGWGQVSDFISCRGSHSCCHSERWLWDH